MSTGAPVVVTCQWSCFLGRRGVIVGRASLPDEYMVQLEGEANELKFGLRELAPASSPGPHFAGAE